MLRKTVCFVNRAMGARIALDILNECELHVSVIVTNDPPHVDLNLDLRGARVNVITWQEFQSLLAGSEDQFDSGVSVFFRHKIPNDVLSRFTRGIVNLHPSLLPYGQGAHPATWAIWEQTPYGATAHMITEIVDAGPVIGQISITTEPQDTSYTLYQKGTQQLWLLYKSRVRPWLLGRNLPIREQEVGGTRHNMKDLGALRLLARNVDLAPEDRERLRRALTMDS